MRCLMNVTPPIDSGHLALILAAGRSRRFGSDKRVALLPDGRTLLTASIEPFIALSIPVVVALRGTDQADHRRLLGCFADHDQVSCVFSARSVEGMGATLAEALGLMSLNPALQGLFVIPGDMPFITPQLIATIRSLTALSRPVVPMVKGQAGHPVWFPRSWFGKLAKLSGDTGAKKLLRAEGAETLWPEVSERGALIDVDHPSELLTL